MLRNKIVAKRNGNLNRVSRVTDSIMPTAMFGASSYKITLHFIADMQQTVVIGVIGHLVQLVTSKKKKRAHIEQKLLIDLLLTCAGKHGKHFCTMSYTRMMSSFDSFHGFYYK